MARAAVAERDAHIRRLSEVSEDVARKLQHRTAELESLRVDYTSMLGRMQAQAAPRDEAMVADLRAQIREHEDTIARLRAAAAVGGGRSTVSRAIDFGDVSAADSRSKAQQTILAQMRNGTAPNSTDILLLTSVFISLRRRNPGSEGRA